MEGVSYLQMIVWWVVFGGVRCQRFWSVVHGGILLGCAVGGVGSRSVAVRSASSGPSISPSGMGGESIG